MPGGYVVRDANGQAIAYVYGRAMLSAMRRALSRCEHLRLLCHGRVIARIQIGERLPGGVADGR
jgi:hypothetical protein